MSSQLAFGASNASGHNTDLAFTRGRGWENSRLYRYEPQMVAAKYLFRGWVVLAIGAILLTASVGNAAGSTASVSAAAAVRTSMPFRASTGQHAGVVLRSSAESKTTVTTKPPKSVAPPSGLRIESAAATSIKLAWTAPSRHLAFAYDVYVDSAMKGVTRSTSYVVGGLTCGTTYSLGVSALGSDRDQSGRASIETSTAPCAAAPSSQPTGAGSGTSTQATTTTITTTTTTPAVGGGGSRSGGGSTAPGGAGPTPDTIAPTVPSGLSVTSASASQISVSWSASTDNTAVKSYEFYLDGSATGTTTSTHATFSGLTCGTTHELSVDAVDSAGNVSGKTSISVSTAACPDTIAPTAPTNLVAKSITTTSVTLGWAASFDNVGVAGYDAYLNGTRVSANTLSTSFTFGGLTCGTMYTLGIDAYDAAANVSTRSSAGVGTAPCPADTTPPSPPTGLATASPTQTSLSLNWIAATDNVGVAGYDVYLNGARASSSTLTTSYTFSGLTCGTVYTLGVDAYDAAANVSTRSSANVGTAPCPADTTSPSLPTGLSTSAPAQTSLTLSWTASTDDVAVTGYNVYVNGSQVGHTAGTSYGLTGLACGTSYTLGVEASDAAGNVSQRVTTNTGTASCASTPAPSPVAEYSFDESGGSTVIDTSGAGNNGTAANSSWVTGHHGEALSFNGSSSLVSIPDSASLHLTSGMTLEAWVKPSSVSAVWRDVIYKGDDNYYLEATSPGGPPAGGGSTGVDYGTSTLAANTWSYLALTYDKSTVRLYVNGTQISTLAVTSSIPTSSNQLQIGGDSIYGQFFNGLIDDVRVYDVALSQSQVQSDMNTPVPAPPPDNQAPSAPTGVAGSSATSTGLRLGWSASTDNIGVAGYTIFENGTSVAQTSTTSYTLTGLTCGTSYTFGVEAYDASGNDSGLTTTSASTAACSSAPSSNGCLASPGSCGFPDPAYGNVGVPAGTALTPSGTITITTPGTIVNGLNVTGQINIEADNVTVENTRIVGTGVQWDIWVSGDNDTIKNVEVTSAPGQDSVVQEGIRSIGGSNTTIENVYSHGVDEAVQAGSGIIEDSYFVSELAVANDHIEDIYCDTTSGLVVNHDTILNPIPQTADIFCNTNNGSGGACQNHLTVENSLLAGGGFQLYPCGNASTAGSSVLTVTGNVFGRCTTTPILWSVYNSNGQTCSGGFPGYSGSGLPPCAVPYPGSGSCSQQPGQVPDHNGYYPLGGYFGVDTSAFCGTPNMTWSRNIWDDDSSTVGC